MAKRIEDKILDILSKTELKEAVDYEIVGGATPSSVLQGPLDYTKPVTKATVPQAHPIPGVGEVGEDDADENDPITDVVDNMDESEMFEDEDDDDKDKDDDGDEDDKLEETFTSLLARLAEENVDEEEGETSLQGDNGGTPKETLPDVDSKLESPDKLVTQAPGIKVAESEIDEEEGETSLQGDNGGTPKETLPDVDSKLDAPDKLVTPAVGAKSPNPPSESHDTDVKEDIEAIFSGAKLSEAAKTKAATIYKAAVTRRVNEEKQRVQQVATKKLKEAFAILKARSEQKQKVYESNLTGQIDRYLNYVVENWMGENRLAVEKGIRAELAESFITGLKNLFVEHYIEVPESKVDVVATLGKKVSKLESKLNESIETNTKMRASLNAYRKEEVVRVVSNGLADTQREKLAKLAEGVEYTTRKEFHSKLVSLKEAYFSKEVKPLKKEEQPLVEQVEKKPKNDEMSVYTRTLTKMGKKE